MVKISDFKKSRLLMEVNLKPIQGERFQPTGFPDIGAATYTLPDGTDKLLVESSQSMANRLEATIIKSDGTLVDELEGLSYVKVNLTGDITSKTSSLVEAHRINSPFIIESEGKKFQNTIIEEMQYSEGHVIDWKSVAKTLFKYDINSLLHGVFFSNVRDGRVKLPRSLSSFIEATGIRDAAYGGVKNNALDPKGVYRAKDYNKDVYGNVPYNRVEYTAEKITAYFNIDLQQLRNFNIGEKETDLLLNLALYKIRLFLDEGLRLRTFCDLQHTENIKYSEKFELPQKQEILSSLKELISECKNSFALPAVTELECPVTLTKKKDK